MEICRKDLMTLNIKKVSARCKDDFGFFPKSFVLPEENEEAYQEMIQNPDKWFILKPSASA